MDYSLSLLLTKLGVTVTISKFIFWRETPILETSIRVIFFLLLQFAEVRQNVKDED